ncbi:hypothetical protein G7007_16840 [Pseudomonas entomophila]|uniref:hypothetical protein n=1 Tax=Pseudomonas entomophila TaxID=312306 RepID=UPI0015E31264|nr:hypothetical protein [Pseudomonas entomophila]MBA1194503.1 hypothetical protein [Pseudomonas entomophila]
MTTKAEMRRLLEAEVALRPTTAGDAEQLQAWVESVSALRQGIPDWSAAMLGLLNDLDSQRKPAVGKE